ncbi:MAG: hypothetical protein AB1511_13070 [Deinococcota bacterium]
MSYETPRRLALAQQARHTLLDLLPTRELWPEPQLMAAADLDPPLFHRVMQELLTGGLAHRHLSLDGLSRLASYCVPATPGGPSGGTVLTADARRVYEHLSGKPDTAPHIRDVLGLSPLAVAHALDLLYQARLVTCRYVGQLNIYCGVL